MAKTTKKPDTDTDIMVAPALKAVPIEDESPEAQIEKADREIEKSIVKYNVTDNILEALKEKHKDLTIKDQGDKEGYNAVHDARMEFVETRVLITKMCKVGRETAVLIQKKWIAKEKVLVERILPDEVRLKKMEDEYDAEKERLKFERLEMQKNRLRDRMKALLAMGAVSDGIDVTLDDISFSQTDIREADEEDWLSDILPLYKTIFDGKEAIRLDNERIAKIAQDKLDEEKAEFQRQQDEFKKQQEQFKQQQKEMAEQKRNARISQLVNIGMGPVFPSGNFVFQTFTIPVWDIDSTTDDDWNNIVVNATNAVNHLKNVAEQQRKLDEERRLEDARKKAEAELREKERNAQLSAMGFTKSSGQNQWDLYKGNVIVPSENVMGVVPNNNLVSTSDDESWVSIISELSDWTKKQDENISEANKKRILKEEEDRKENLRLQQLEESEKATDKVKWDTFLNQINAIVLPTMKRQPYKGYVDTAAALIKKINSI